MDLFLEKQFIKRWWLFMFILAIIVIGMGTSYYATMNAEEETAVIVSLISFLIVLPIVLALLYLRMETRIDEKGVFTHFRPFGFTKRYYPWEDIKDIFVRTYDPKTEYGGWGLRVFGGNRESYNVAGNTGVQIITKDDKKFLIGTQKAEEAKKVIENYHTSTNTTSI